MTIHDLVVEFQRLDQEAAEGYVGHDPSQNDWPTVGYRAGGGGHAVVSVHPDDIDAAVNVLRQFPDAAANLKGFESFSYNPEWAMAKVGVRCKWHI